MRTSAVVIADSISKTGKRLTTFEIVYPRVILAELNTHRMTSKNSSSSRAQPVNAVALQVENAPFVPDTWWKNRRGMTVAEKLDSAEADEADSAWRITAANSVDAADFLASREVAKGQANRLLEPFTWMKTVVTATEWDNFFWLRNHKDADPEIQKLAKAMKDAMDTSAPLHLLYGEWHVPYYEFGAWRPTELRSSSGENVDSFGRTLEEALKISVSCCCQVSYRKNDASLEKADKIYGMLHLGEEGQRVHASPTEHQGTPISELMDNIRSPDTWSTGVTAYHKTLGWMSGNLAGWIQYRQTIPYNTKWGE